jgi:hypothetical protein
MIPLLGKYFRKWLLRLALAARKKTEAAVSRLASVDEAKVNENGRRGRSETSKNGRHHGPPDHWVQMVKRHAPELLQPALPNVADFGASQVFEDYYAGDASEEPDISGLRSGKEALENVCAPDDPHLPLKTVRKPEDSDLWQASFQKDPDDIFIQFPEAVPKTFTDPQRGNLSFPSSENITENSNSLRAHDAPVKERRKESQQAPDHKLTLKPAFSRLRTSQQRNPETTGEPMPFAAFSFPHASYAGSTRQNAKKRMTLPDSRSNFRSWKGNDATVVQSDLLEEKISKRSQSHSEMSAFREAKSQVAPEESRGLMEFFMPSVQHTEKSDKVSTQPDQVPIMDRHGRLSYAGKKTGAIERIASGPTELQWPILPGEYGSENRSDLLSTPIWPNLPDEKSIGMWSTQERTKIRPVEAESAETERLRRLDEEQKGMTWIALHF